jgi:Right handed beta helix region
MSKTCRGDLLTVGLVVALALVAGATLASAQPRGKKTPTPTPSAQPTETATPDGTQTETPTDTPSQAPTPVLSTFYVSPTGDDSNPGTADAAWRTIQHAADVLLAGQQAVVAAGTYAERVRISSSGTDASPIVIQSASGANVELLGFTISGSYWTLTGFDISTQTNGDDGYGIYLTGNASYDTVQANYVHELCREGIYMDPSVSHISVINNRIWRAEMAGINVDGFYQTVEGNEIWDTLQAPRKLGGIYKKCTTPSGADADGIRFFGQHHVIRSNQIHDINDGTPANRNPHIDCFQTWGSAAGAVDYILIERNWCRWPAASSSIDNEVAMIEGLDGPVGTVTYQNNVFANMRQGINVGANVSALSVLNNTWDHILQEAVIFMDTRTAADQIINNIFYDVGSGEDSYICIPAGTPTIATNNFTMRSGPPGTYCSNAPYLDSDPMFQSAGDSTGAGANYHLRSESPIIDNATMLSAVGDDFDGTRRPIGDGYSIGAFEE